MNYRFHLIAPPNTQTTKAYYLDGFTQATIKFARMLKSLGHYVIIYGSEECDAPYDELVQVVSKEEITKGIGDSPYQYAAADNKYPLWELANTRTIEAIKARKKPKDFICLIGGISQKPIADAHKDLMTVEYSIGYEGTFADNRVYESYAWMHTNYAAQGIKDGRFFDTVIPYFFDPDEYPFSSAKEDFALYVGRLTSRKGLQIACQAAKTAGVPLKVIGHGDPKLVTDGAEYLGELDDVKKKDWMCRAKALLCPTMYIEPFGSVAVEAMLCGTPVIATDFGAFTETITPVSGVRCSTLKEFALGLHLAKDFDHTAIRNEAIEHYSMTYIKERYQDYFDRLMLRWDKGWYG